MQWLKRLIGRQEIRQVKPHRGDLHLTPPYKRPEIQIIRAKPLRDIEPNYGAPLDVVARRFDWYGKQK